jgi:hypothetical protein
MPAATETGAATRRERVVGIQDSSAHGAAGDAGATTTRRRAAPGGRCSPSLCRICAAEPSPDLRRAWPPGWSWVRIASMAWSRGRGSRRHVAEAGMRRLAASRAAGSRRGGVPPPRIGPRPGGGAAPGAPLRRPCSFSRADLRRQRGQAGPVEECERGEGRRQARRPWQRRSARGGERECKREEREGGLVCSAPPGMHEVGRRLHFAAHHAATAGPSTIGFGSAFCRCRPC